MKHTLPTGLVLSGGGARAGYQVGVLKAIARIRRESLGRMGQVRRRREGRENPFKIITGTSAGAVNGVALACGADDFDHVVGRLVDVWENFHAEQVYRADSLGIIRSGAGWLTMMSIGWLLSRWRHGMPRSLLDNTPLLELLQGLVPLERLPGLMAGGHLQALAVTASSYSSGTHVSFFQCAGERPPWERTQRIAVRADITHAHLLASSAIPFVFPAVQLPLLGGQEYFGDGSMRQVAPLSPAIHLGAQRLVVIGAGRMNEPPGQNRVAEGYPSVAQIAGHALSNIFLDALAVDVERLQRINRTLSLMTPARLAQTSLRPIDLLVIAPTQRLDDIAARHVGSLPATIRTLLGVLGVRGTVGDIRGAALASYLLFEAPYTRELVQLGHDDAMDRREEIEAFFGWGSALTTMREAG
jgi:NTE family protein